MAKVNGEFLPLEDSSNLLRVLFSALLSIRLII